MVLMWKNDLGQQDSGYFATTVSARKQKNILLE